MAYWKSCVINTSSHRFRLPCQHLVCNECLLRICKVDWDKTKQSSEEGAERGVEVTKCPQCREEYDREEVKTVQYTATDQWDKLATIATQWAKMDNQRPADDTSEEGEEENFLNDQSTETE